MMMDDLRVLAVYGGESNGSIALFKLLDGVGEGNDLSWAIRS